MKVINVGLSILISMGLAVSPIHANEIDSTDETNEVEAVNQEETTVNDESNVESQADEKKVTSIYVKSEDDNTQYTLDENETQTIKLVVINVMRMVQKKRQRIINIKQIIQVPIFLYRILKERFRIMFYIPEVITY